MTSVRLFWCRHVYNHRDYLRRVGFEGRDVVGQLCHLAMKNNYINWMIADPDTKVLTHLFLAHPDSLNLLRTYPWFIGMDSTYKTNRYKMPFLEITGMTPCNNNFMVAYAFMKDETEGSYRWVLERLRLLVGNAVQPTVIVTDRELGLMRPISDIFPETQHLLCTWHINKDVEDRAYKIFAKNRKMAARFTQGIWRRVMEAPTEQEYEDAVMYLGERMRVYPRVVSYVTGTWLVHKQKFVRAWTNNALHLGNTTTCRVESAHAVLKQWLNSSTGALDTVWTKVHKEIESQLTQIRYVVNQQ